MIGALAKFAVGTYLVGEAFTAFGVRRWNRRAAFRLAAEAAARLQKPLLVVGDPDSGFVTRLFGRDYGCGDVCTDLTGCPLCPSGIRGRLEDVLPRLGDKSVVIYESLTLEYVDDLPAIARQIDRVGARYFGVRLEPGSSTFLLYGRPKWVIRSMQPWVFSPYGAR